MKSTTLPSVHHYTRLLRSPEPNTNPDISTNSLQSSSDASLDVENDAVSHCETSHCGRVVTVNESILPVPPRQNSLALLFCGASDDANVGGMVPESLPNSPLDGVTSSPLEPYPPHLVKVVFEKNGVNMEMRSDVAKLLQHRTTRCFSSHSVSSEEKTLSRNTTDLSPSTSANTTDTNPRTDIEDRASTDIADSPCKSINADNLPSNSKLANHSDRDLETDGLLPTKSGAQSSLSLSNIHCDVQSTMSQLKDMLDNTSTDAMMSEFTPSNIPSTKSDVNVCIKSRDGDEAVMKTHSDTHKNNYPDKVITSVGEEGGRGEENKEVQLTNKHDITDTHKVNYPEKVATLVVEEGEGEEVKHQLSLSECLEQLSIVSRDRQLLSHQLQLLQKHLADDSRQLSRQLQLQGALDNSREQLAQCRDECDALRRNVAQLKQQQQHEQPNEERQYWEEKLSQQCDLVSQLRDELEQQRELAAKRLTDTESVQYQLKNCELRECLQLQQLEDTRAALGRRNAELKAATAQLSEGRSQWRQLICDMSSARQAATTSQHRVDQTATSLQHVRAQLEHSQQAALETSQQLSIAVAEVARLKRVCQTLQSEVDASRRCVEVERSRAVVQRQVLIGQLTRIGSEMQRAQQMPSVEQRNLLATSVKQLEKSIDVGIDRELYNLQQQCVLAESDDEAHTDKNASGLRHVEDCDKLKEVEANDLGKERDIFKCESNLSSEIDSLEKIKNHANTYNITISTDKTTVSGINNEYMSTNEPSSVQKIEPNSPHRNTSTICSQNTTCRCCYLLAESRQTLHNQTAQLASVQNDLDRALNECSEQRKRSAAQRSELERSDRERCALETALASANEEKRHVDGVLTELDRHSERASTRLARLSSELAAKERQLDRLQKVLDERDAQLVAAEARSLELHQIKQQLQMAENKQAVFEQLSQQNQQLMIERHRLKTTADATNEELELMKSSFSERKLNWQASCERVELLEKVLAERDTEVEWLQENLEQTRQQLGEVKQIARNMHLQHDTVSKSTTTSTNTTEAQNSNTSDIYEPLCETSLNSETVLSVENVIGSCQINESTDSNKDDGVIDDRDKCVIESVDNVEKNDELYTNSPTPDVVKVSDPNIHKRSSMTLREWRERERRYQSNIHVLTRRLHQYMRPPKEGREQQEEVVGDYQADGERLRDEAKLTREKLQEKVDALTGRLENSLEANGELHARCGQLQERLVEFECREERWRAAENCQQEVTAETQLKLQSQLVASEDAANQLKYQLLTCQSHLSSTQQQLSSIEMARLTSDELLSSRDNELTELKHQLAQAENQLSEQFSHLQRLQQLVHEAEARENDVGRQLAESHSHQHLLAQQIRSLSEQLKQKSLQLAGCEQQLQQSAVNHSTEVSKLQSVLADWSESCARIQQQLDQCDLERGRLQIQCDQLTTALQAIEDEKRVIEGGLVPPSPPPVPDQSTIAQLLEQCARENSESFSAPCRPIDELNSCLNSLRSQIQQIKLQNSGVDCEYERFNVGRVNHVNSSALGVGTSERTATSIGGPANYSEMDDSPLTANSCPETDRLRAYFSADEKSVF